MTVRTTTPRRAFAPHTPRRRRGLFARLFDADARFREGQAMKRLTEEQRRDMGLPPAEDKVAARARANMRFLTHQW
ncbi:hypothetical protein P1J78_15880 [Psychromarinibacter sp. C21-152]|uniref:DUF1127 domain-containing protein n=1 Tax=Psychromarinibacter sediminicola TaxID=3033385 RepID=A0AAE3NWH2_9RHOB|nr:hypothetical protein [Psychromarinibacter sediminicola]MDF0602220.1 hypothetical protein [Psychromarinibacter sediminicola]